MSTGKAYEISGETTEWEDILIKKGVKTKEEVYLEKGLNPLDYIDKKGKADEEDDLLDSREAYLESATLEELDELEEEDDEVSDARILEEYRQRRLNEMKELRVKARFGDVREINKDDWVREVTECSRGCWVAVHLYQDSVVECRLVDEVITVLAPKFKEVKFLKIRSTSAVENWPNRNLPTIFFYNGGELKKQIMTLKALGGTSMNASDLEWWMVQNGIISTSELQENPRDSKESDSVGINGRSRTTPSTIFRGSQMTAYSSDED